jgi:peptidoglycan/xylan/chitin deacetylase (PgdA/CDA1 family)
VPQTTRLAIIGYHNVTPTATSEFPLDVGIRGFHSQLEALARHANVVPIGDALRTLEQGGRLPPRAVSITVDDGYRDALEVVAPLLGHYGLPATFFVVPGFIDRTCDAWWETLGWAVMSSTHRDVTWRGVRYPLSRRRQRVSALASLCERFKSLDRAAREQAVEDLVGLLAPVGRTPRGELFLDWDGCRELARRGFEIGSHSATHAILAKEDPEDQVKDLRWAREIIESHLDGPVELLSYPNGRFVDYSDDTIRAAQAAGYRHAVTTEHGWNDPTTPPFELRRVVVSPLLGAAGLLKTIAQFVLAPVRTRGRVDIAPTTRAKAVQ